MGASSPVKQCIVARYLSLVVAPSGLLARPPSTHPPPPPPTHSPTDHKPVYAVLEANLPITDQAKKRAICSRLLKRCAAAALGRQVDEEGRAEGEVALPAVSLQPDHVKLHQEAMVRGGRGVGRGGVVCGVRNEMCGWLGGGGCGGWF